jgi:hypothetical protein
MGQKNKITRRHCRQRGAHSQRRRMTMTIRRNLPPAAAIHIQPLLVGISLGSPATKRFLRRVGTKFERASTALTSRSVYHLNGEARQG